jgi:hypothetical protein
MAVPAVLDLPVGRDPVDLVGVLARGHRIPILVLREGHGHVTAFGLFRGLDDSVRSIVSASPLDVNLGHNGQALLPMMSASIVTSSRARIEPRVKLTFSSGRADCERNWSESMPAHEPVVSSAHRRCAHGWWRSWERANEKQEGRLNPRR